jgi:phosphatidate cytidylyltransferase
MASLRDLGIRAVSALVLAPLAVLAIWAGDRWFLAIMLAACVVLAREWAQMCAPKRPIPIAWAVGGALVAVTAIADAGALSPALVTLVFAAAAAGLFARRFSCFPSPRPPPRACSPVASVRRAWMRPMACFISAGPRFC